MRRTAEPFLPEHCPAVLISHRFVGFGEVWRATGFDSQGLEQVMTVRKTFSLLNPMLPEPSQVTPITGPNGVDLPSATLRPDLASHHTRQELNPQKLCSSQVPWEPCWLWRPLHEEPLHLRNQVMTRNISSSRQHLQHPW